MQPRADIRAHDKLDALDFGLHEHDPHVLRLGRVGVTAQRLDRIRLQKAKPKVLFFKKTLPRGDGRAHLSADVIEKGTEHLRLHGEYVWGVPLVEPVPHELLEERVERRAKV